jgi:hypothetical protein
LGGPVPYWVDFTYDKLGNRRTETKHTAQDDTVRTCEYPNPGEPQPHTLRAVTQKGPNGETRDEFGYNAKGETITRKIAAADRWTEEVTAARATLRRLDAIVESARRSEPPCNSFVPGTQVLMADGSRKPIEEVKLGDQVLSTDPKTGETCPRTVVATIVGSGTKQLVELTVGSGPAISSVTATEGHPFWNATTSQWEKASDLAPGDSLLTPSREFRAVTAVRHRSADQRVFSLTVEGVHTYDVATAFSASLVHNSSLCGPGLDALSQSGMRPAKGGLSHAGREYQKHMNRGELQVISGK